MLFTQPLALLDEKAFDYHNRLGYVPYNVGNQRECCSHIRVRLHDWCIYQLGLKLGKSAKELKPFKLRAMNYQNVFDKETGLMRGRNEDGSFQSPLILSNGVMPSRKETAGITRGAYSMTLQDWQS